MAGDDPNGRDGQPCPMPDQRTPLSQSAAGEPAQNFKEGAAKPPGDPRPAGKRLITSSSATARGAMLAISTPEMRKNKGVAEFSNRVRRLVLMAPALRYPSTVLVC